MENADLLGHSLLLYGYCFCYGEKPNLSPLSAYALETNMQILRSYYT